MAVASDDPRWFDHPIIIEKRAAYRIATIKLMFGAVTAAGGASVTVWVLWYVERNRDIGTSALLGLLLILGFSLGSLIFSTYHLLTLRIRFKAECAQAEYNLERWGENFQRWSTGEMPGNREQGERRRTRAREGKFGLKRKRKRADDPSENVNSEPGVGE
ncbi:hypothetical protein [Nocardia fluminea]|uniref:Transmembrane protein n=1 Tax=Nocardia fluminea TaxID=134984 RepID=A0A2N3VE04_9NOCA|nr:hypothetical protein [Nocardia fluminea]PKV79837.1 hypothetical protein ATK86_4251 [Nocardia fluminea]